MALAAQVTNTTAERSESLEGKRFKSLVEGWGRAAGERMEGEKWERLSGSLG